MSGKLWLLCIDSEKRHILLSLFTPYWQSAQCKYSYNTFPQPAAIESQSTYHFSSLNQSAFSVLQLAIPPHPKPLKPDLKPTPRPKEAIWKTTHLNTFFWEVNTPKNDLAYVIIAVRPSVIDQERQGNISTYTKTDEWRSQRLPTSSNYLSSSFDNNILLLYELYGPWTLELLSPKSCYEWA